MNFPKNHEDDALFQKIPTSNPNDQGSKKDGISNQTKDKVEAAKSYIESFFFL